MPLLTNAIDAFTTLRDASSRYSLGLSPLVRRFLHLYRKRRFSPYEIRFNDLLNPRISDEGLDCYMSKEEMLAFDEQHVLGGYLCVTMDKAVFYSVCMAAGIPVPRLLAVFDQPAGWLPDGRMLHSRSDWCGFLQSLPQDFVVKPALGLLGQGVTGFHREADVFVDHEGARRTDEELYELPLSRGRTEPVHDRLRASFPEIAARQPQDHHPGKALHPPRDCRAHRVRPRSARAAFSLAPTGPGISSSWVQRSEWRAAIRSWTTSIRARRGNLWCSVDPNSGRIMDALGKPPGSKRLVFASKHPIAGNDVVGFQIPHWQPGPSSSDGIWPAFSARSP